MRSETFDANNWRWLRAYWFEECKDDLILDGIWPAVERVCTSERPAAAYFQRHWFAGPHILLGINAATPNDAVNEIAAAIRAYLAAHPSSGQRSVSEIDRRMEKLRAQEHLIRARQNPETVPIRLQPNNSVQVETTEPYSPFLNDEALKVTVREFLSRSAGLAVHWLKLIRDGHVDRQEICLQLMIALAWLADPDRFRSHLSFYSHAKALLDVRDKRSRGALRRMFAAKYEGPAGDRVRSMLRDSTEKLSGGLEPVSRMCEFVDLLRDTMADLFIGVRSGRYQFGTAAQSVPAVQVGKASRENINYGRIAELLEGQPAMRTWQITISLVYQVLNQMGMQAADRFLACYLLSRAAEDLFGQSAETIRQNLDATGDPRAMFTFFSPLATINRSA